MSIGVLSKYLFIGLGVVLALGVVALLTQSVPRAVYAVRVDNQSDVAYRVAISGETGAGRVEEIVVKPQSSTNKQVLAFLSRASASIDIVLDVAPDGRHPDYGRASATIPTHVWQAVGCLHGDGTNLISITIVPGGIVRFMLGTSLNGSE